MPAARVQIVQDTVTPRLTGWSERMRRQIEMELDAVGADMLDIARSLVPVRTGFLRDSIAYDVRDISIYLNASAGYAAFVEFGTSRMGPRPYLRPAVDARRDAYEDAIMTGILNTWRRA